MTLNITLASRWAIYQSSDFKLTQTSGSRLIIRNMPQKQVIIQYMDWVGLVAYSGIAAFGTHRTAEWLTRVLCHQSGKRSPNMVLRLLRDAGNRWITQVPLTDRHHTFTVVMFDAKGPRVCYVSTYQRAGGQDLPSPRPTFFITAFRPKGPWCGPTGSGANYVSAEDRARLIDMLVRNESTLLIREAVAEANKNTAKALKRNSAEKAYNTVSEECVSSHLLPNGTGEAQVFGEIDKPFIANLIVNGRNMAEVIPEAIAQAGRTTPHRLVGVTWNSTGKASAMVVAYREVPGA